MSTLLTKPLTIKSVSEALGIVLGSLFASTIIILIEAFLVQWILVACGIYQATYLQAVGAIAIWHIVRPRSSKS